MVPLVTENPERFSAANGTFGTNVTTGGNVVTIGIKGNPHDKFYKKELRKSWSHQNRSKNGDVMGV